MITVGFQHQNAGLTVSGKNCVMNGMEEVINGKIRAVYKPEFMWQSSPAIWNLVIGRCHSIKFFKTFSKIGKVIKTDFIGDLCNIVFFLGKELCRSF